MAIHKSEYYRLNGSSWDLYLFRTTADMVDETSTKKIMTDVERTKITNHLTNFNAANKLLQLDEDGEIPIKLIPGGLDYLPIGGGTLLGNLNLGKNNIVNINKITIPSSTASIDFSALDEITINGTYRFDLSTLNMGGNRITNVKDPIAGTDAATRQWVQQYVAQGTHVVGAARVATTGGAITELKGTPTIDGITVAVGDRVLVKDQESTDATQNGLYLVNSGAWTKIAQDSDKGSLVFVTEGTTNKGKQYYNLNGTTWELFFIQDTYYASLDGGLELNTSGFGFKIADDGIVTKMIKNSQVTADKLAKITGSESITGWNNMATAAADYSLKTHIDRLYSAIKLSRGTANYNTNNTQSISDAYNKIRLKNKIDAGSTVPSTPAGYDNGDVYIKILSTT